MTRKINDQQHRYCYVSNSTVLLRESDNVGGSKWINYLLEKSFPIGVVGYINNAKVSHLTHQQHPFFK